VRRVLLRHLEAQQLRPCANSQVMCDLNEHSPADNRVRQSQPTRRAHGVPAV
jgi:hypothetical protein